MENDVLNVEKKKSAASFKKDKKKITNSKRGQALS